MPRPRLYTLTLTDAQGNVVQTFANVGQDDGGRYDIAVQDSILRDLRNVIDADKRGQWPRGAASVEWGETYQELAELAARAERLVRHG